jgi:hypothetical protein
MLRTIYSQFRERYRVVRDLRIEEGPGREVLLDRLVGEISRHLLPGHRELVLLDGLDEGGITGSTLVHHQLHIPDQLPRGIFFVMTSTFNTPLAVSSKQEVFQLFPHSSSNLYDLTVFVASQIEQRIFLSYMASSQVSPEALVASVVARSCGNFLCARYLVAEINRGTRHDLPLETSPLGLQRYYEALWHRLRLDHGESFWTNFLLAALMALTITGEPLSVQRILDLTGSRDRRQLRIALQLWEPCVRAALLNGEGEALYAFDHRSFEEFVAEKAEHPEEREALLRLRLQITERLWADAGR